MYSDSDIDDAVAEGALTPEAAAEFRAYVARRRASPPADEEHFRLITSFNDVFVVVAAALLLLAVGWIAGDRHYALGGAAVGLVSWVLAEYFTRRKRMALPSIFLLLTFVGGVFAAVWLLLTGEYWREPSGDDTTPAALVAALAAWLHWRRFHVPITVAAGVAALAGGLLGLVGHWAVTHHPADATKFVKSVMFLAGVGVFALAMRWDLLDRARRTGRSDVAFWLHLLAAPLMVHPVFSLTSGSQVPDPVLSAIVVVILYVLVGIVALAIDRRALLVSALAYLLIAVYGLVQEFHASSLRNAIAALIVGAALLVLSAFWRNTRQAILMRLPHSWRRRLPAAGT